MYQCKVYANDSYRVNVQLWLTTFPYQLTERNQMDGMWAELLIGQSIDCHDNRVIIIIISDGRPAPIGQDN